MQRGPSVTLESLLFHIENRQSIVNCCSTQGIFRKHFKKKIKLKIAYFSVNILILRVEKELKPKSYMFLSVVSQIHMYSIHC